MGDWEEVYWGDVLGCTGEEGRFVRLTSTLSHTDPPIFPLVASIVKPCRSKVTEGRCPFLINSGQLVQVHSWGVRYTEYRYIPSLECALYRVQVILGMCII